MSSITKGQLADYRTALFKVPKYRAAKFAGIPLRELITREDLPVLTPGTVDRYLADLVAFFNWMRLHDLITGTPDAVLGGVKLSPAKTRRDAFSDADLQTVFGPSYPADTGGRLEFYWVPLLMAYQGARLEEMAQLHREDVHKVGSVWCIAITDAHGGHLKTEASRRTIPVHPELIGLGFVEYVKVAAEGHLWPGLRHVRNGYGEPVGSWFNARLRRLGITSPKKVLYSFRHTFITRLLSADVPQAIVEQLDGHAPVGMTAGNYFKGAPVAKLREAIEKLTLPILPPPPPKTGRL